MPVPSPVHEITASYCTSMRWKDWAGYYAVCSYDTCHEREYFAFRHGAGLIDVTPLFKYEVTGKDAAKFLARIMIKDITKLKVGQVTYTLWCDEEGYIVDDGTVTRISEDHFRVTAAEPSLAWFARFQRGYTVSIADSSKDFAAFSLQGPNSRMILSAVAGEAVNALKFFRYMEANINNVPVSISRTGYTGDLGYEIWVRSEDAKPVYEYLLKVGRTFSILPCGLDAMDMTRIEAGFVMNGVDYYSANHCMIDSRKSTPYELGLDWCVQLDRESFNGQIALRREKIAGPRKKMVGLDIDWMELENAFSKHDLAPEVAPRAWRDGKPIYNQNGQFIGFATSGTWSPMLKKNLALAHVRPAYAAVGTKLKFEITVEYERVPIQATVVKTPFFDPPRKRA